MFLGLVKIAVPILYGTFRAAGVATVDENPEVRELSGAAAREPGEHDGA